MRSMKQAILVAALCSLLSSCGLSGLGGVGGAGLRAAALGTAGRVGAGAAGAGAAGEAAALGVGRLAISPGVATAAEGSLARAISQLGSGRTVLTMDSAGGISAGSEGLAIFRGSQVMAGDTAVGYLGRNGFLYSSDTGALVGRLKGLIPRRGAVLEVAEKGSVSSLRPIMVDILEMRDGRYLVQLASGETAWIEAGLLALTLIEADEDAYCRHGGGAGVLVRTSGEAIAFESCDSGSEVSLVWVAGEPMAIAADDIAAVHYDRWAIELAALSEPTPETEVVEADDNEPVAI